MNGYKTIIASLAMFLGGLASSQDIVIPQDEGAATVSIIAGVLFFVLRLVTTGPVIGRPRD